MVVLAIHNLMVVLVSTFNIFLEIFDLATWTYWSPLLPEILILSVEFIPLTLAIAWCSVLIRKSICVLVVSTSFIKKLSELGVIMCIVFAFSYV